MAIRNHQSRRSSQACNLSGCIIDEHGPGSILRDFQTMLEHVDTTQPLLSKTGLLPLAHLTELNARLGRPLSIGLTRPQLRSFPNIQALFLLLRATGITQARRDGRALRLRQDAGMLARWEALNHTERWFSLLETWLLRADPTTAGEERVQELYGAIQRFARLLLAHPRQRFPDPPAQERDLGYRPGYLNLALMEMFGLVEIEHGTAGRGQGWRVLAVVSTSFGEALLRPLVADLDDLPFTGQSLLGDPGEAVQRGALRALLGPSFPAWQDSLEPPAWPFQPGEFLFKVSLSPQVWRRLSVAADVDWDAFSWAILDAFGFDRDHLYFFEYQTPTGNRVHLHHPYMDEPPYAAEVQVGSVPLNLGDRLMFVYDLGDEWRFDLELEAITAERTDYAGVEFIASHGDAPEQYQLSEW